MSQHLSITQTGPVARITLTMPEIRNAFSDEVIQAITEAFADVGARAEEAGLDGLAHVAQDAAGDVPERNPGSAAGDLADGL